MKCIGCGICCIVCTDIQLTQKEKKDARYDTKKRNGKGNLNGYSNMVLRRRLVYINELKNDIYACVYFDPKKRRCIIYENRPIVCRNYDCDKKDGRPYLFEVWKKIKSGDINYLCLEA